MRMSRYLPALLSLVLAAPAGLAAQGFEGTLKQTHTAVMPQGVAALAGADVTDPARILDALADKVKTADPSYVNTQDMTLTVKGAKMRVDGMSGGMGPGSYALMDAEAGMVYQVAPAQKQIMTISAAEVPMVAKRMAEQMGITPAATPAAPTTTDLGMKTVGGLQLHGYRVTTADGVGTVWVDPAMKNAFDAFKDFQQKMSAMNPGTGQMEAALQGLGFPVLLDYVSKAPPMLGQGWMYTHVEISDVQKHAVADDVFALPADFTKVSVAQLMGITQ